MKKNPLSGQWRMVIAVIALALCLLVGNLWTASKNVQCNAQNNAPFKVGFLCVGPITDQGWNFAHNKGRLFLEKQSNGQVQTIIAEKISESAEAERVLEKMIAQGTRLIFLTSYGFLEPGLRVAARHPDVALMQINRFEIGKNFGSYFSNQYQPMYLTGMVAGRMTKTNKLGFVAPHPIPVILQSINAFTMGARSVNPKAETHVVWINNWSDAPLEAEAVKGLVETQCDVIANTQDNQNTVLPTCESAGVYSTGYYNDAHQLAPKGWLTGACLDWGPFYVKIANAVRNHTWKPCTYTAGLEGGYIKLSTLGKVVPASVQKEVLAKEKLIESGKFTVFQGPMKDREGKERIAAGQKPDIKQLSEMTWFVSGVQGSLPK